ncbi:MAG: 50S ribosomal protein L11 methyltransferase [Oscillospiraceae bacterium]
MDWTELSIIIPVAYVEQAAAIASLVAGGGVYIEDYSDLEQQTLEIAHIDLIDEELLNKRRDQAIVHIYLSPGTSPAEAISFAGQQLSKCEIPFSIETKGVREEDWATAWKRYYHPVELSDHLAICPTWESFSPKAGQRVIRLDPGMAFGTGTHETTRLCLSMLEMRLRQGMSMLDVGCGSGILAICAKLLGAGRTVGVDIDSVAVRVAQENAILNDCGSIAFCLGDLATGVVGPFDIICANIVADAILRLACDLPLLMHKDSVCIVSGIIDSRRSEVEKGLAAVGLASIAVEEQNGWAAIACCKASGQAISHSPAFGAAMT